MPNLVYSHPSDNVSPLSSGGVDWTVNTGTLDASYPAANLGDLNPAKPARLTTTTGSWVRNLGSAKKVDLVFIPHHNLTAGLDVRIQGNATDSWGTPTLNEQMTVPAYDQDGYPVGFFKDLTSLASRTFQYWRFVVVGTNGANVAIGEILLVSTKRSLVDPIGFGTVDLRSRKLIEHVTDYDVATMYDLGVKLRRLESDHMPSPAGKDAIIAWWDACNGRAKPTMIIRNPDLNEAFFVRWDQSELSETRTYKLRSTMRLAWKEVSRGLVL